MTQEELQEKIEEFLATLPALEILPKEEETLLETAQSLKGEALDAWLETLTFEEQKELWIQCIITMVDVILPQMSRLFGIPKEAYDGD